MTLRWRATHWRVSDWDCGGKPISSVSMKPRVNLRLDSKLHARLGETAVSRRVSKTDVLEEALSLYFDPERNLISIPSGTWPWKTGS